MVSVIGVGQTAFARAGSFDHAALAQAALGAALQDAGADVEAVWFGSAAGHIFGRATLGGMHALGGLLAPAIPIVSVEGACATGGIAVHAAACAIAAGDYDCVAVIGVDLSKVPDPVALLDGAIHRETLPFARRQDPSLEPSPGRPVLLDVAATEARHALRTGVLSRGDLARLVEVHRAHGALNPDAWLRKPISADAVLGEPSILDPFTRSMGCALVDGAAAVILSSDRLLDDSSRRSRAVQIDSICIGGGSFRALGETPALATLGARALSRARRSPQEIDLLEVHDANAFVALKWAAALGCGSLSEAAARVRDGQTTREGVLPINLSGGLLSKGHALAATGIGQIVEITRQLRGEAGERQAGRARVALAHNGGGLLGFDDAISAVSVLSRRG